MQIYNTELRSWIALYTDQKPAKPPIPNPAKQPYLQIVLPYSLKSDDYFKDNFSEIMSYGYSSIKNEALIITISGARKIVDTINLMRKQKAYCQKQNNQVFIQLRKLTQALRVQIQLKPPTAKSKNIANYEIAVDTNAQQRQNSNSIHQTIKLKRKGNGYEEIFKHSVNRDIIDIEAFNSICYRLLLNQQTPKARAIHNASGKRLGVISRAIPNFRSLHDYYRAKKASPPQADLIKAKMGRVLAAAFCEEENDLHGGNIGFDPDELRSYKIDNDQATWPFTSKYRNIHPQKIGLNKARRNFGIKPADAFPITQRDLNNFPYLTDARPNNFPDKSDNARLDLKGIGKDEHFIYDAFSIFLKRALIDKQVYRNIANATIRNEKLREQLAAHKANRSEILKSELIANVKFAKFLLTHPDLKTQLLSEFGEYNKEHKATSPLQVDLARIATEFDRVKKRSETFYFAKIDQKLNTLFEKCYQPETDYNHDLVFNCKAKRINTLKQIMSELQVNRAAAAQLFNRAYQRWLDKPANKARKVVSREAEAKLETIMQNLLALDGKLGRFGGERCQLADGSEIKIAKGAAAIFKHYQDYKRGLQPSAPKALNQIILQAYHSNNNQSHGFFNRRQNEVSCFYQSVMTLKPDIWSYIEEEPVNNCCC